MSDVSSSRKQKQQIRIGDDVVITVLQIKGGSVRLGIEAPREVHVMRGELEDFRESQPAPERTNREILAMSAHSPAVVSETSSESVASTDESGSGGEFDRFPATNS